MSKSNQFETDLLRLIFNGTAIANIADNAASSPATNLYAALHSADPGEAGDQSTSEVSYTGYSRAAISRNSSGFTVSGNTVTLTSDVNFSACSGGSATATHFSIGTASSGTGKILFRGALDSSIVISNGVTPGLDAATSITED